MLKRRDLCRWRCHWSFLSLSAIALVVYNIVFNIWLLRPPSCPAPTPAIASPPDPPICEPCSDTNASNSIDDDPIAKLDIRLGRWDSTRSYRLFDYAAVGDLYAEISANRRVALATQSSIERLHELLRIAAHWSGPISVAVFVTGDELIYLRAFTTWMYRCQPEVYARLALHVAMPSVRPGVHDKMPKWARNCAARPLIAEERQEDTLKWRKRHPYPQNHMRNLARKNCHSRLVLLVDVDIVPSRGMAEDLEKFFENAPKCALCAYVVPTYELDTRVANYPANKTELIRLARKKLAMPFHLKVFIFNQYATNLTRWESTGGNESSDTHVSHNVTNFELLYEPFYVAPDTVPAHDERFMGYGFTRNTQVQYTELMVGGRRIPRMMMEARVPVVPHWVCRLSYGAALTDNMFCAGHFLIGGVSSCQVYEMYVVGYQFRVLSPIFSIHWGLQKKKARQLWREKQNDRNRYRFETFKREVFARYKKDPLHLLRRLPKQGPQAAKNVPDKSHARAT